MTISAIRAVIFDVLGTVVDKNGTVRREAAEMFDAASLPLGELSSFLDEWEREQGPAWTPSAPRARPGPTATRSGVLLSRTGSGPGGGRCRSPSWSDWPPWGIGSWLPDRTDPSPGTNAENDERFGLSVATIGELAALLDRP